MSTTHGRRCAGFVVRAFVLMTVADAAQVPADFGVVVEEVAAGSPAEKAGLRTGDRLLTYDGKPLVSPATLQAAVENTFGKDTVSVRLRRSGALSTFTVSQGRFRADVRPEFSSDVLSGYADGRASLQAQKKEDAISRWMAAARTAQAAGDGVGAAWLYRTVGELHERERRWEEARGAYAAAWTVLGGGSDAASQSRVLSGLGRCSRNLNDLPASDRWFRQAWQVDAAAGYEAWAATDLSELGSTASARGDLAAAEDFDGRALAIRARLAPDSLAVAASLNNLGADAEARGDLARAQDHHLRALSIRERLAPDSLEIAWNLNNLGNVAWARSELATAQDYHKRALAIRERLAPDSLDVAASFNNLAGIASMRGELGAAEESHRRALAIKERLAPDSLTLATSLNNIGGVVQERGDLDAAQSYYSRALAIRESLAPGSLAVASTLNNLGNVLRSRGDLEAAQTYHSRALAIRERLAPNSLLVAASLNNVGVIARSRGDLAAAHDYQSRSLALKERLAPDSLDVAASLTNLSSIAQDRGDLPAAQGYESRALAIRERLAPDSLFLAESLTNLGTIAESRGAFAPAQDYYGRALAIRERLAPGSLAVAESLTNLGNVARARGDLAAARDYHARSLAIHEQIAPDALAAAESLANVADLAFRERRFIDARTLFARAVTIVEAQRRQIGSADARALLLARHSDPYRGLVRTAVALDDLAAAFAISERGRARSLVELLAERPLDFRAEAPAELLALQASLDQERSAAYGGLTTTATELIKTRTSLSRLDPNDGRVPASRQSIQRLEQQMEALRGDVARIVVQQREVETRMRQASPRLAMLQYPAPLDLKQAQELLDTGTLALAYVVDDEQTYLFAVTRTDARVVRLTVGGAQLSEKTRLFRQLVARERLGNAAEAGRQLYDILVRPAQDLVDHAQRLLIIPDGPLHVLPFAAMVSRPAPALRYLIEDKPLHTVFSMTVYAETRTAARSPRPRTQPRRLLAFGDPVYTKGQPDAATPADTETASLRKRGLDLGPLPQSRQEVEAIVRLFGTSAAAKLGPQATETAAKRETRDVDILHFAVHGWIDEEIGLSSGLALSQPEAVGRVPTAEDNGLLQAWEIFERVRLNADLVVLSACQTGLGQELRGEGLIGLTRAFLYAGARSVVVSLWDVSDPATAAYMTAFYGELRKGASKDVALQRAMIAVSRNPRCRHPFFWAPFILVGDWQ